MNHRIAFCLVLASLPATVLVAEEPQQAEPPQIVIENLVIEVQADQGVAVEPKVIQLKPAEAAEKPAQAEEAASEEEDRAASEKELRQKMRELEQQLQEARNKFQEKANQQREKVKKDALKALEDIKLPQNPTREQCEAYVRELRTACEGRRSFSSSDPATQKLKEIPAEHVDLLVAEMAGRTSLRYYANYAIREIDPKKLRKRFVESLDESPNNIGIIVMHGWTQDVRPAIINHIKNADGTISPAWFQAGVEIGEPELYPKLHEITTQSRYASQFINMLEMLPDYDLGHTIDVCWRRAREGKLSVSTSSFAAKAAQHGNIDALGALIDQLRTSTSYMSHSTSYNIRRANVLRYIDYRGSNTDIQQWYMDNKDKLVFDHLTKRFMLPEAF